MRALEVWSKFGVCCQWMLNHGAGSLTQSMDGILMIISWIHSPIPIQHSITTIIIIIITHWVIMNSRWGSWPGSCVLHSHHWNSMALLLDNIIKEDTFILESCMNSFGSIQTPFCCSMMINGHWIRGKSNIGPYVFVREFGWIKGNSIFNVISPSERQINRREFNKDGSLLLVYVAVSIQWILTTNHWWVRRGTSPIFLMDYDYESCEAQIEKSETSFRPLHLLSSLFF